MPSAQPPDGAPETLVPGAPRSSRDGAGAASATRVAAESPNDGRGPRVASREGSDALATTEQETAGGRATESLEPGGVTVGTPGGAQELDAAGAARQPDEAGLAVARVLITLVAAPSEGPASVRA
jgi:hypothetical protein